MFLNQGFRRNRVDKIDNGINSKSHNSARNHRAKTGLRYLQQGSVLINPIKFSQNPTKGFGETARIKFQWKYFKVP